MSVSLKLLDEIGDGVCLAVFSHLSKGQTTVGQVFKEVVEPNGWKMARNRIDRDLKDLVALKYAKVVMIDSRRKAYRITELGKRRLRTAQEFFRSV